MLQRSQLTVATTKQRNVNDLADNVRLFSLKSKANRPPSYIPHFVDKSYSLFSLPLELRRHVYKYLFNRGTIIVIDEDGSCVSAARMSTQLLRICKTVCEEFAAVLFSSCIIAADHPFNLAHCFKNLGPLPRRFVQEISITVPHNFILPDFNRNHRHKRADVPKQSPICDKPLQHLPCLKKITLSNTISGSEDSHYWTAIETFARTALRSNPSDGNILNEHMCLCSSGEDVTWNVKLKSEWTEVLGSHPAIVLKDFEMETHFEFRKAANNVEHPSKERWQFRDNGAARVTDAEGTGWGDSVTLWRREVLEPSVPWEPSELKAPA